MDTEPQKYASEEDMHLHKNNMMEHSMDSVELKILK